MGQVVPFIARVRDSGDWTAAERARLEALARTLEDEQARTKLIAQLRALLGWEPRHDDLEYIVGTAWRWEQRLKAMRP